jgi:hypothetical protein
MLKLWQLLVLLFQLPYAMATAIFYRKDPQLELSASVVSVKSSFRLSDPYQQEGTYYRAQLHFHTNLSLDGRWSRQEALASYKKNGYRVLAITNHDLVNHYLCDDPELLIIPAEEHTFPRPFWPLGPHAVVLFSQKHARGFSFGQRLQNMTSMGGLVTIAHPSWPGSFSTGQWSMAELLRLSANLQCMEVCSSHSDPQEDTLRWHELISYLGPQKAIWATAGDDAHSSDFYNYCWVEIKAQSLDSVSIRQALQRGSFYPTMGPLAEYATEGNLLNVSLAEEAKIIFIAGLGYPKPPQIAWESQGRSASYQPTGTEQFIRVEIVNDRGQRAWSQPFWLLPE